MSEEEIRDWIEEREREKLEEDRKHPTQENVAVMRQLNMIETFLIDMKEIAQDIRMNAFTEADEVVAMADMIQDMDNLLEKAEWFGKAYYIRHRIHKYDEKIKVVAEE